MKSWFMEVAERHFRFQERMKFVEIDFSKPWWHFLLGHRLLVILGIINQLIGGIAFTIAPIVFAGAVDRRDLGMFIYLVLGVVCVRLINHVLYYFDVLLRVVIPQNIAYSANAFFLLVDPTYHSLRSSGQIISKINRGSSGLQNFLDNMVFDVVNLVAALIGIVISFAYYDLQFALYATLTILLVLFLNIVLFYLKNSSYQTTINHFEDEATKTNVESMNQAVYIRASFATIDQLDQLHDKNKDYIVKEGFSWRVSAFIITICGVIYNLMIIPLAYLLFQNHTLSSAVIVSLLGTYFVFYSRIFVFGQTVNRVLRNITGIQDLWDFINNFGKQSYPVLKQK